MLARIALVALALASFGCSKSETRARLPAVVNVPVQPPAAQVSTDESNAASDGVDPADFAQVVTIEGTTYVVLSDDPKDESWGKGAPSLVSEGNPVVTKRRVDQAVLPKSTKRLVGRKMSLFGSKGEVCQGTLAEPELISRVEPHFGERDRWGGEEIDGVVTPPITPQRIADQAWEMSAGGRLLVSEIVPTNGACHDALFARASEKPAVKVSSSGRVSKQVEARAMAELAKLDAYKDAEDSYRQWSHAEAGKTWIEASDSIVTVSELSLGAETYVWLSASGGMVCEGFSVQLGVLWKVDQTNPSNVRFSVEYQGEAEFNPHMILQLVDGQAPVFVGRESLLRKGSEGYSVEELHVPFLDCPC